jgi:hypothetical protein
MDLISQRQSLKVGFRGLHHSKHSQKHSKVSDKKHLQTLDGPSATFFASIHYQIECIPRAAAQTKKRFSGLNSKQIASTGRPAGAPSAQVRSPFTLSSQSEE